MIQHILPRWGVPLVAGLSVHIATGALAVQKDRFEIGEEVPVFTLKAINADDAGETYVTVDKYFGEAAKEPKKALLLSFFATYCEPCKKEMPYLAALYENYKDQGLQVLLVTIDKEPDKINEARALAKKAKVRFPLLSDRFNIVARRYFIQKLPCVYILDAEGKVAMVNVGYSDDVSKTLLDEIRKHIGEPASDPIPGPLAKYVAHAAPAPTAEVAAPPATDGAGDAKAEEPATKKKKKKRKKKRRKKKR